MTGSRDLESIISNASIWAITSDGKISAFLSSGLWARDPDISIEILSQRHPLLPHAIASLCTELNSDGTFKKANASLVRATLAALDNKLILSHTPGDRLRYFSRLSAIEEDVNHPAQVHIVGQMALFQTEDIEGPMIPIVYKTELVRMDIEKQYWDTHYEGWSQRLDVGSTLGLTFPETVSFAFTCSGMPVDKSATCLPDGFEL